MTSANSGVASPLKTGEVPGGSLPVAVDRMDVGVASWVGIEFATQPPIKAGRSAMPTSAVNLIGFLLNMSAPDQVWIAVSMRIRLTQTEAHHQPLDEIQ